MSIHASTTSDHPGRVDARRVIGWAEHHVGGQAEAIFTAGTGLRAA